MFKLLQSHTTEPEIRAENIAARTDVGLVREHNEDDYLYIAIPGESAVLCVVTDGMGGHDGGELASYFTTESLFKIWTSQDKGFESKAKETEELIAKCIQKINYKVFSINNFLGIDRPMGTTVTAALFTPGKVTLFQVGDSRCYLWRENHLQQLTEDQTLVARMVRHGTISEAEAKNHPLSHLLSNCLGSSDYLPIDITHHKRRPGDRFLVCSDGLYGSMGFDDIKRTLSKHPSPSFAINELFELAFRGGGKDNITAILVFDK